MLKKLNNMMDKNIYKVNLISIKNNENAYIDLSKKENVAKMTGEVVKQIYIQRTMSCNYVREVITGMLIPVRKELIARKYCKYIDMENCLLSGTSFLNNNNRPVYILNGIENGSSFFYLGCNFYSYDLCKVYNKELSEYIEEHKDVDAWRLELENIFKEGERRYDEAISKNLVSDKTKTAHMVKTLKKDN